MSTAATLPSRYTPARNRPTLYLREIRFELLRVARNRGFLFSTLGFPMLFYVLFGVVNKGATMHGNVDVAKYLLGGYTAFGMVGAALFGIGVGLALDRTSGWLELKRASPMPPLANIVARCATSLVFSLFIVATLCTLGTVFAGVHLSIPELLRMFGVAALGSVPFAGMGLLLAALLPANAAPGTVNMIYLPMSYCSGLWVPFAMLPHWVQRLAPFLPTYHLAQLMEEALGYGIPGDSAALHIAALLGFTLLFLGGAALAYSRAEEA